MSPPSENTRSLLNPFQGSAKGGLTVSLGASSGVAVDYDASLQILKDQNIDDAKIQIITNQFNECGINIDAKSMVSVLACPVGSPVECIQGFAQTLEEEKKEAILKKIDYFTALCSKGKSGTTGSSNDTTPPTQPPPEEEHHDTPPPPAGQDNNGTSEPAVPPKEETPQPEPEHDDTPPANNPPEEKQPEPKTGDTPPVEQGQSGTSGNPDDYTVPPPDKNSTDFTPSTKTPPAIVTLTAPPALQTPPEIGKTVLPPCDATNTTAPSPKEVSGTAEEPGTSSQDPEPNTENTDQGTDPTTGTPDKGADPIAGTSSTDKGNAGVPETPSSDLPKKKPEMPVSDSTNSGNKMVSTNSILGAVGIICVFMLF